VKLDPAYWGRKSQIFCKNLLSQSSRQQK